jgi:hypothetical protein
VLVVAQIATTAATARLVSPREFGLYATAQAVAALGGYFALSAVGQGLQRRSSLGDKTVGTAFLISFASSLLVGTCLWLGGSLLADLWGIPDAAWAVRVLGVAVFLRSLATVPIALIRRDLRFGNAAAIETGAIVLGMVAGVGFAVHLHSALALAIGQALGAAALLIAVALAVQTRVRPAFHRTDGRELAAFAGQVNALGLVAYAINTVPVWFVARFFGAQTLGFYSRGALVANLPAEYAVTSVFKVVYPLYGRVRGDAEKTARLVNEAITLTTGFLWPAFGLLAGAAPVVVSVLLGPQWDPVAPLLTLFAIGACGNIATGLLTNAAEAFGWMRTIALRQMAFAALVVVALAIVYATGVPVTWVAASVAFAEWGAFFATLQPFVRKGVVDAHRTLAQQAVHLVVAGTAFGGSAACSQTLEGMSIVAQMGGQVVVGALVVLVIVVGRNWIPAMVVLRERLGGWDHLDLLRRVPATPRVSG